VSVDQDAIIRYRMERARQAQATARLTADAGDWSACINRLYYACFYAVSALLLQRGYSSSKHSGVRSLFNRHFGRSGALAPELVEQYNALFDLRLSGDYGDFVYFEAAAVRPRLAVVGRFIDRVEGLLAVENMATGQEPPP
jgi:uncharacterized protein (UPF0332 family)